MSEFVVETCGLTKRYGTVIAVQDLTMRVRRGEVYGFLGPNGAGKTTTLRMLLGLARPSAGQATVLGAWPGCTTSTWSPCSSPTKSRPASPRWLDLLLPDKHRSLSEADAVELNTRIGRMLFDLSACLDAPIDVVSRSDSTPGGHVLAEVRALDAVRRHSSPLAHGRV